MEKTTVQISKETLERLKQFKQHPRESYDEILTTLMDTQVERKDAVRKLIKFAGTISKERGEEMFTTITEIREQSRKRSP